jgi:capsid portal protein
MYHIPFSNVRSGKMDDDDEVVEYFYSSDWSNVRKNKPVSYRAFDPADNKGDNASQIYYCYNYTPGNDYYPLPAYVGALNDIALDMRVSRYHNANISNGLSPSMFIQFRNGIPTPEERTEIYRELDQTFSGEDNAGKFFLAFSEPGKELEVTPVESVNDEYYITLEERITSRILTAHRITSPALLGISKGSGFSSVADEIIVSYAHFESTVIEPKRKKVLTSFGYMLKLFGFNISIEVSPKEIVIADTTVNEEETQNID